MIPSVAVTILITALYLSCLLLMWRWRPGVFGLVIWEAMKDPVRKLLHEHVVSMALAGSLLWVACLVGCFRDVDTKRYPFVPGQFRLPAMLLLAFLGFAFVSGLCHEVPIRVIGLGFVSYVFPLIGLLVGFHFGKSAASVRELMAIYCLLNAVLIGSAFLEIAGYQSPVLGGIMMEWYRFRGTHNIPLPCGIYRSPDILGLHAAHVFIFGMLLTITTTKTLPRLAWFGLMYWGGLVLMISARRKMHGLAVVFLLVFVGLLIYGSRRSILTKIKSIPMKAYLSAATVCAIGMMAFWIYASAQVVYAASILDEGPSRVFSSLILSPDVTISQSGFWGVGLGSATQGNSIVGHGFVSGWQEDGLSRLVLEGGVPGALCIVLGVLFLIVNSLRRVVTCVSETPHSIEARCTLSTGLLSLFAGNLACYCISHQHLSGDPMFGALTGFWVGCIWTGREPQSKDDQ